VKIGLLDGIATLDGVINQLLNGPPPATGKVKGQTMDAIAQWESAVKEKLKSNPRMSKADATRAVVQEQPELHQAYLAAYNEKWGPRVRGR
jgi:hypothetical protein